MLNEKLLKKLLMILRKKFLMISKTKEKNEHIDDLMI